MSSFKGITTHGSRGISTPAATISDSPRLRTPPSSQTKGLSYVGVSFLAVDIDLLLTLIELLFPLCESHLLGVDIVLLFPNGIDLILGFLNTRSPSIRPGVY